MGKRAQKTTKKKGEFFFNFEKLRRKLNSKQKAKLIKFFANFRTMFLTVKQHLFQVNKMYDLMEQEYKKFQKDLFKNDEYLAGPHQNEDEKNENSEKGEEEFFLDDDIMKQILDEGLKDEKEKNKEDDKDEKDDKDDNGGKNIVDKELLEKYDLDLGKDFFEKENENKDKEENGEIEKKESNNEYSEKFFDWRKKNI